MRENNAMKKRGILAGFLALSVLFTQTVKAHCPLCTAGAGALALGAVAIGVSPAVVAIFIGGFAMSMGMWTSKWAKRKFLKKNYVPFQEGFIVLLVFLSTLVPIISMLAVFKGFNIFLYGSYGGLLNRSYMYNLSWVTSLFGAFVVFKSPSWNKKIKEMRDGKGIPFQGTILTITLLLVVGGILQILL